MVEQNVKICNPTGLHLRPAGIFCQEAMKYTSKITFQYGNNNEANAKSVLSVLGACVKSGDELVLRCEGEDEQEALSALVSLIGKGFEE
ncbi:MAG: HPr family phosphocarrier protein [Lachnospiraceae bacterium]|nr:HPr family phosphocarrier protein [Lachnospiraceae bacterium]MDD6192114.1 HPr family phosphocarrier protein [Lachnospiraceae bacterium]MDY4793015.1 HPr family phosphocarrier protein [Pararoseburia sp.]